MNKILITCSNSPDLDGYACALALSHYKNQTDLENEYFYSFGKLGHEESQFIRQKLDLNYPLINEDEAYEQFILVDTSEQKGLPKIIQPEKVVEIIDHRLFPDYEYFPQAKFQIEPLGAAATQIAELFYFNQKVVLPQELATLLLCAIYSNTNKFSSDTTNFRDLRMQKWLVEFAKADADLPEEMFAHKTKYAEENLAEVLLSDYKEYDSCGFYQLEVNNSQNIQSQLLEKSLLQELSQGKNYILAIQDLQTKSTFILANKLSFLEKMETGGVKFPRKDTFWQTDRIYMRKSLIKAISNL